MSRLRAFELPTISKAVHAGGDDSSPLAGLSGYYWNSGVSVHPSVPSSTCFSDFDLIWCVGRPRPHMRTSVTSTRPKVKVTELPKFRKVHFSTSISFALLAMSSRRRSELTSSLLSLYTSAYMEQHRHTLLMNSACRRISAHDAAFIQLHLRHWSSAVRVCQPSVTGLLLSPPHTWNGLLQHATSASSLSTFCRCLKTHLFQRCFPWLFVSCLSSDFCHFRTR